MTIYLEIRHFLRILADCLLRAVFKLTRPGLLNQLIYTHNQMKPEPTHNSRHRISPIMIRNPAILHADNFRVYRSVTKPYQIDAKRLQNPQKGKQKNGV
jgi:hypothetical protein